VFQWYVFHVYGVGLSLLAVGVELELAWLYDVHVGGVPVHFDFLRHWVARAALYLVVACVCAASAFDTYGGLWDLDKALMWVWTALAVVYAVFYAHLVTSAMFYRWYIAHGAWFSKHAADGGGGGDGESGGLGSASETSALLGAYLDEATPSGLRGPALPRARAAAAGGGSAGGPNNRLQGPGGGGGAAAKKKEPMKRFVLQPRGKLVVHPVKFSEGPRSSALPDGVGPTPEPLAVKFFVKCLLGDDGASGQSRRVAPLQDKAAKRNAPLASSAAAAAAGGSSGSGEGRVAQWAEAEAIPLEVSSAVARAGKDAALEVQVWCEVNGVKGPYVPGKGGELQVNSFCDVGIVFFYSAFSARHFFKLARVCSALAHDCFEAAVGGDWGGGGLLPRLTRCATCGLQAGEARVALDQLTLGVPGAVQLHAAHAPAQAKGSLELVIAYEPPPEDSDDRAQRKARDRASAAAKAASAAGPGGGSGGDGSGGGTYESAIDPASGRKYYYNRATGHRTWTKPAAASQGPSAYRLADGDATLTNASI
jgi:hypothetical protein